MSREMEGQCSEPFSWRWIASRRSRKKTSSSLSSTSAASSMACGSNASTHRSRSTTSFPFHSIDFSEHLLELHEAEVERLKAHYEENKVLFSKVFQRQEVWSKFIELENRTKDPTR